MAKTKKQEAKVASAPKHSMFTVRALWLTAAMVAVYMFLTSADVGTLNSYSQAYKARIGFYASKIDTLSAISSWKKRMFLRHTNAFQVATWIAENRRSTDTILLPPAEYAGRYMKDATIWTDPRIFTYFANFQPIIAYADTARWSQANTLVVLENNAIYLSREGGRFNLDSIRNEYRLAKSKATANK